MAYSSLPRLLIHLLFGFGFLLRSGLCSGASRLLTSDTTDILLREGSSTTTTTTASSFASFTASSGLPSLTTSLALV